MKTAKKSISFNELIRSDTPVLVDFYASWCGPCKMLAPVLSQLASRQKNSLKVVKVDVDKNPGAAQALKVRGVPTLILFSKGKQLWRQSGYMSLSQLEAQLAAHLEN